MATDLSSPEKLLTFVKGAAKANPDAPLVHLDKDRAEKIRAVLQEARRGGEFGAHWTQKSAYAFAKEIGFGEMAEAIGDGEPLDSRDWPIVNVEGRLISLDPFHDCHQNGKPPAVFR